MLTAELLRVLAAHPPKLLAGAGITRAVLSLEMVVCVRNVRFHSADISIFFVFHDAQRRTNPEPPKFCEYSRYEQHVEPYTVVCTDKKCRYSQYLQYPTPPCPLNTLNVLSAVGEIFGLIPDTFFIFCIYGSSRRCRIQNPINTASTRSMNSCSIRTLKWCQYL